MISYVPCIESVLKVIKIGSTLRSSTDLLKSLSDAATDIGYNGVIKIELLGNSWEPISRWLSLDSRLVSDTSSLNRLSSFDIDSICQILGFVFLKSRSSKLTPFNTSWIPSSLKNLLRKAPLVSALSYKYEMSYTVSLPDNFTTSLSLSSSQPPDLKPTIVLPARNESGNANKIEYALTQISKTLPNSEVILVEGNSTDNTWEILTEIHAKFKPMLDLKIVKQTGKGKKNAVICGFHDCSGDVLAIIDTDFSVNIDDSLRALLLSMKSPDCLINCVRLVYPMEKGAMRWANYIGNRSYAMIMSLLTSQRIGDSLCGTKIFTKKLYQSMLQDGSWLSDEDPFGDFTILFGASKHNYRILNYPVRYLARTSGAPNISRWIDGLKLAKICFLFAAKSGV